MSGSAELLHELDVVEATGGGQALLAEADGLRARLDLPRPLLLHRDQHLCGRVLVLEVASLPHVDLRPRQ
eukprot:10104151-Heterocapsa_arctica.AAC.1